jgi:hypothetical protein
MLSFYTMEKPLFFLLLIAVGMAIPRHSAAQVTLQASTPSAQQGSTGEDRKGASRYGKVLGHDWGGHTGDWAKYPFHTGSISSPVYLHLRYAREIAGTSHLRATLDGIDRGSVTLPSTGGWGDREDHFRVVTLKIGALRAGDHTLRLTVELPIRAKLHLLPSVPVLDLVGNRTDKNSVGHGVNVALYTGTPSRFFYSTYNLGDVFSAVDGATLRWFPDYTLVDPHGSGNPLNANLDQITIDSQPGNVPTDAESSAYPIDEQRQVCVTREDVVVSRVTLTNRSAEAVTHRIEITGDCRGSVDYRGRPGGEKATRIEGDTLFLTDKNAFPSVLHNGLVMAIGSSLRPTSSVASTLGAYRLAFDIPVPAHATKVTTFACAFARDEAAAKAHLTRALGESDPVAQNRADWKDFYAHQIPQFTCSDRGLNEIYGFRWFLLKFTLSGGDLGYFRYPVDMEGRQEFQTYCTVDDFQKTRNPCPSASGMI